MLEISRFFSIIMLRVVDVDHIKDYELLVTFNDGSKKKVDLKPYLTKRAYIARIEKDETDMQLSSFLSLSKALGIKLKTEY